MISFLPGVLVAAMAAPSAAAPSAVSSHWDYKVETSSAGESVTTSTRYSLLVANPGTKKETRIEVKSVCRKTPGESVYGDCEHELAIAPGARRLTVKGGEDIGLAYLGGFNGDIDPVIAALTYGCCGGPNKLAYTTLDGTRLGYLQTFRDVHPIVDQTWNLENVADHRSSLLIEEDPATAQGPLKYVLRTQAGPQRYTREPVRVVVKDPQDCEYWTIESFDKYLDLPQPMLAFRAYECEGDLWKGPCEKKDGEWLCTLSPAQQP